MVFLNCSSVCVYVCFVYMYLWHHLSAWNPESSEELGVLELELEILGVTMQVLGIIPGL